MKINCAFSIINVNLETNLNNEIHFKSSLIIILIEIYQNTLE